MAYDEDKATAMRSLKSRASRLALPRRVQAYLAAPDLYWLRPGQCWRVGALRGRRGRA